MITIYEIENKIVLFSLFHLLSETVFSDAKIPVHSRLKPRKSACTIVSGYRFLVSP